VETAEQMHERVQAGWDAHQRAAMASMTSWGTFPFETEGLRVVPLEAPELPEAPRGGEGGRPCRACATTEAGAEGDEAERVVWRDERWRLKVLEPSGAPLVLILEPLAHHDLVDLPDALAAELGVLGVHVARAVESLPGVARCHLMRIGDGGAHLHVFFFARPEGFGQLRGSFLVVWDDLLPPGPADEVLADAARVGAALAASYGGAAT
jgi:diadenosine tetraphosphate (Ap4A) HIT family hydrolase